MGFDGVRVCWFNLDTRGVGERDLVAHVREGEWTRIASLATSELRVAAALRVALRRVALGHWLEVDPMEVALSVDDRGRSTVRHDERTYAVSASSHDVVGIVAAGCTGALGVDVTRIGSISDPARFLSRAATAKERAEVTAAGPDRVHGMVSRLWTRKEAYLKATGEGVSAQVARIEVPCGEASAGRKFAPLGTSEWWVLEPDAPDANFIAAIVAESDPVEPFVVAVDEKRLGAASILGVDR
jgi:4'-phosphopantetheinyl transferase